MRNAAIHILRETDDVSAAIDFSREKILPIDTANGPQRTVPPKSPKERPQQG
jgi:hypothetical protein